MAGKGWGEYYLRVDGRRLSVKMKCVMIRAKRRMAQQAAIEIGGWLVPTSFEGRLAGGPMLVRRGIRSVGRPGLFASGSSGDRGSLRSTALDEGGPKDGTLFLRAVRSVGRRLKDRSWGRWTIGDCPIARRPLRLECLTGGVSLRSEDEGSLDLGAIAYTAGRRSL